jgi:hypothetical protein
VMMLSMLMITAPSLKVIGPRVADEPAAHDDRDPEDGRCECFASISSRRRKDTPAHGRNFREKPGLPSAQPRPSRRPKGFFGSFAYMTFSLPAHCSGDQRLRIQHRTLCQSPGSAISLRPAGTAGLHDAAGPAPDDTRVCRRSAALPAGLILVPILWLWPPVHLDLNAGNSWTLQHLRNERIGVALGF